MIFKRLARVQSFLMQSIGSRDILSRKAVDGLGFVCKHESIIKSFHELGDKK